MIEIKNVIKGVVKNTARKGSNPEYKARVNHAGTMIKDYFIKQTIVNGNFTLVNVGNSVGASFIGIAKRNPKDTNTIRGAALATARAVKQALDSFI